MKDQFEKNIQQAMDKHALPVSDSVWASIQKKQSKKPLFFYISRVSAACLILFLGLFSYNMFNTAQPDINTIVVDTKPINTLDINHSNNLKQILADLPIEKITEEPHAPIKKVETLSTQELELPEKEVIVLNIKPKKRKLKGKPSTDRYAPRQKTRVESKVLLAHIEEKLEIKHEKELESYLTDIKKLASKNSINNKIQTAQNWIAKQKQHPIFEKLTKKRKNND